MKPVSKERTGKILGMTDLSNAEKIFILHA